MPAIKFIGHFSSCNRYIFCIEHNAHISIFLVWRIGRFIFALNYSCYLRCQSSKDLVVKLLKTTSNILSSIILSLLEKNIMPDIKHRTRITTWPFASNTRQRKPSKSILLSPASAFCVYCRYQVYTGAI